MSQTVTSTEKPQTFCVLPEQKKADEGSLLGSLAKVTLFVSIGCGLHSLGAQNAADKAGEKFEEFVTEFANMDTFDREQFVQNIRDLGSPIFSGFSQIKNSTELVLQARAEQMVSFGGSLQELFSKQVLENLPSANLGIQETVNAISEAAYNTFLNGLAGVSFLGSFYVGMKKKGLI